MSISSTYLHTAFTLLDPQSIRTQSSFQYLFTLLGSMCVKAVRRTLIKLSPSVNFTNVLHAAFALVDPKSIKNTVKSSVSFYAFGSPGVRNARLVKDIVVLYNRLNPNWFILDTLPSKNKGKSMQTLFKRGHVDFFLHIFDYN